MALAHNPLITVAREQVAEADAGRAQNIAIPDPAGSASIANQHGFPSSKPISATINLPFPSKFALQYDIGTAGVKAPNTTTWRLYSRSPPRPRRPMTPCASPCATERT